MEIIYATYQYFPDYRTNTFQSMTTINEFIKNDIKVKLIFPERKIPTTNKDIYEFYNLNSKLKITKIKHTKYFKYLNDSLFNRIIYLANHFIFAFRVKNYTSSSHQEETVLYTRSAIVLFMMRNSNKKLVYEIHQLTRLSIFLTNFSYKRNKKILFVTITPTLKNMVLDIGIDESNVMYLETGYNEEEFSGIEKIEKRNDNKVKFIFGGSLTIAGQSKGLEEIISSLDNLIKLGEVKNCTFSIYCSNQYEKEQLLDFINKNNIEKDIKIYNRINSTEFLRELLNSDIGVIPLPDTNHVNKFSSSMKYFEYIRAGLVIVCSNVEANKRFNYPKSIFYNNESEEIALAIKSSIEMLSSGVAFDKKNIQEYSIQNRVYRIVKKINEI